jgi:predicted secreted protein
MTFDTLKSGTTQPTADLDHLINQLAFQVRSTRSEYGLTQEQQQEIYNRFSRVLEAYPEITARVEEACNTDNRFWQQPADTQLKYLDSAGLLVDTLGV